MKLQEQLSRMREMFSSLNEGNFEKKEYKQYQYEDIDIEVVEDGSTDVTLDLYLIKGEDNYEVYRLYVEYSYDEGEPQTYDYPGVDPHVEDILLVRGYELNEDGEEGRELDKFELDSLYHDNNISKQIDGVVNDAFNNNYESGYYEPDDEYDRDDW